MNAKSQTGRRAVLAIAACSGIATVVAFTSFVFDTPRRAKAAPTALAQSTISALQFRDDGQLLQPHGYRRWVYVGAPITPNDMNRGEAAFPEFHSVYINPEAFDEYQKTGEFPNGTVLVKELVSVGSKAATSSFSIPKLALRAEHVNQQGLD